MKTFFKIVIAVVVINLIVVNVLANLGMIKLGINEDKAS